MWGLPQKKGILENRLKGRACGEESHRSEWRGRNEGRHSLDASGFFVRDAQSVRRTLARCVPVGEATLPRRPLLWCWMCLCCRSTRRARTPRRVGGRSPDAGPVRASGFRPCGRTTDTFWPGGGDESAFVSWRRAGGRSRPHPFEIRSRRRHCAAMRRPCGSRDRRGSRRRFGRGAPRMGSQALKGLHRWRIVIVYVDGSGNPNLDPRRRYVTPRPRLFRGRRRLWAKSH